jgi:hypothetical protein
MSAVRVTGDTSVSSRMEMVAEPDPHVHENSGIWTGLPSWSWHCMSKIPTGRDEKRVCTVAEPAPDPSVVIVKVTT